MLEIFRISRLGSSTQHIYNQLVRDNIEASWLCMVEILITYKSALPAIVFVCLFAFERFYAKAVNNAGNARYFRNAGLGALNLLISPLIILPLTWWASNNAFVTRPDWWSGVAGLMLDILILDCWIYFMHRAMHAIPVLWRLHEIHHRDEFLDTTSAIRFHFTEVITSSLVRAGLIITLGVPFTSVLVFETLVLSFALFHHANVKLPAGVERVLSRVIVTPSIHWVHHHTVRADTNSNYATIFSWWDRLFGTRSKTRRWEEMPIGLDDARDIPLQMLIVQPFKKKDETRDA